jgi:hypothetical protein
VEQQLGVSERRPGILPASWPVYVYFSLHGGGQSVGRPCCLSRSHTRCRSTRRGALCRTNSPSPPAVKPTPTGLDPVSEAHVLYFEGSLFRISAMCFFHRAISRSRDFSKSAMQAEIIIDKQYTGSCNMHIGFSHISSLQEPCLRLIDVREHL